jgi:hypothetical protein
MLHSPLHKIAMLLVVIPALGCGDDEITPPSTTGAIEVRTTTSGVEPDPDGYAVQVDAGPTQAIGVAATILSSDLSPGSHAVQLTGVATNCTVAENPRAVVVAPGETSIVSFVVACSATTGELQITSTTSGPAQDDDGYAVTVDGVERDTVANAGAITISGLAPGHHEVGLTSLAANCQVSGTNPQSITIIPGQSATLAFAVTCVAPPPNSGTLRVTTTTTGPDGDLNGYAFAVDDGAAQTIGPNAAARLANVSGGEHTVRLSNIATNCSVQGANPRSVTVTAGDVAQASFAVACIATTGSAVVSLTVSGTPAGGSTYSVTLDGKAPGLALTPGTPTSFTRLPPGRHTVELAGVASNCTVADGTAREFEVEAGKQVAIGFALACADATGSLTITTATTGVSPDPNGYVVTLDGTERAPIEINAQLTLERLAPGAHSVGLNGLTPNCAVTGENPQPVTIAQGATATLSFAVSCQTPTGLVWTPMVAEGTSDLHDVWGTSATDVYAVGGQQIMHYDGAQWSEQHRLESTPGSDTWGLPGGLRGVWGTSPTDVFAVGGNFPGGTLEPNYGTVLHSNGSGWSELTRFAEEDADFTMVNAVWGSSATDVFVVGAYEFSRSSRPLIAHFDGVRWTAMTPPGDVTDVGLYDVWGTSSTDVYAVGTRGLNGSSGYTGVVLHYDGTAWTKVAESPGHPLVAVWGSSPGDVIAGSTSGPFLHYDGAAWTPMATPVRARENIWGLWGFAANQVFAVGGAYSFPDGRKGAVHHYDGTNWLEQTGGASAPLYAAWGSSPTDVFAVGGTILRGTAQPTLVSGR